MALKKKQKLELEIIIPSILILTVIVLIAFNTRAPQVPSPTAPAGPQKPRVTTAPEAEAPGIPAVPEQSVAIAARSAPVFAYAHGTAEAGGKIFIGMANRNGNPFPTNQLFVFDSLPDLTKYKVLSLRSEGDIESMTTDPTSGEVYFTFSGKGLFSIYRIDPGTLWMNPVFSTTTIDIGNKPAIVALDNAVYGITNTDPSSVFKLDLTHGQFSLSPTGHIANGHSAAAVRYGSTTELYFASGMSDRFEKDDAATLSPLASIGLPPCSVTDDMPAVRVGDSAGYVYLGCEVTPYGYRVKTDDLSVRRFSLPGSSYGMFIFGGDLYNAAQDGDYDVFPNLDVDAISRFHVFDASTTSNVNLQRMSLNELFRIGTSSELLFTAWHGVPGLFEVSPTPDSPM